VVRALVEYSPDAYYYATEKGVIPIGFPTPRDCNYRVEPGAIIYPDCIIGDYSVIGANAVLRPYTKIGHHSIFGTASVSEGHCRIGDYTTIHAQCHITQHVTIGNECFIAPFFIATNTPEITKGRHGTEPTEEYEPKTTIIKNNVRIGSNVRLIPGLTIGHDALIMQDTLLTKDVPPYAIMKGGKDKVGVIVGWTDK
jgi:UDP-2-acetamido-3-amino-2,3-dideoxy-glucuronate N-acetyltransferase